GGVRRAQTRGIRRRHRHPPPRLRTGRRRGGPAGGPARRADPSLRDGGEQGSLLRRAPQPGYPRLRRNLTLLRYRFAVARNVKAPLAASFACAAALGLLVVLAFGVEASRHLDVVLFFRVVEHRHSSGGTWADAIATLGNPLPMLGMLAVACAIALLRGRSTDALAAVLVVAGANVTTQLLKVLLAHPRVKAAIGGDPFEPNTFPSGHTTAAASIAIAFAFV